MIRKIANAKFQKPLDKPKTVCYTKCATACSTLFRSAGEGVKKTTTKGGDGVFHIDPAAKTPIYEQIRSEILGMVSRGELRTGDRLPSIRALSAAIGINVNTVKKVFALLEADGVIETVTGSGSYIAATAHRNEQLLSRAAEELSLAAMHAKNAGLSETEALRVLQKIYKEEKTT